MALPTNNDFLSQASEDNSGKEPAKRKRRTALEIEQEKYPEYHSLNAYDKRCLVANNYWRVMFGKPIVEVPPSDEHYHKYFDKKCYDRAKDYQAMKQREREYDEMISKHREENEKKKEVNNNTIDKVDVIDSVDKVDVIDKIAEEAIEKHHETLKNLNDDKNNDIKKETKNNNGKKATNNNNEQGSLF